MSHPPPWREQTDTSSLTRFLEDTEGKREAPHTLGTCASPLPFLPLPHAECTLMTQTHLLGHAPAASIVLPSQAAAGETALRQVTQPRGGGLGAPDAYLGAGTFRSPKARCGPPGPGGRRPCSGWASPQPPAELRVPTAALRGAPHLRLRRPPSAPLPEACRPPPPIGSATSGMHCPLTVNPIIVIK